jgi:hypothetical protein
MSEEADGTGVDFYCESQDNDLVDLKARKEGENIHISIQENNELLYIEMTTTQARAFGEWLLKSTHAGDAP